MHVSERLQKWRPVFREFPLPPGEGGAKRRVRARMPKHWAFLPSSGPAGHLLPKGEGLARGFLQLIWTTLLGECGHREGYSTSLFTVARILPAEVCLVAGQPENGHTIGPSNSRTRPGFHPPALDRHCSSHENEDGARLNHRSFRPRQGPRRLLRARPVLRPL